jgi:ABC-type branched-subunit amino acid transport system permease subunit
MLSLLNGRHEPGRSAVFWVAFVAVVVGLGFLPEILGRYALLNLNSFMLMAFLAAGLSLLWGFGGVLSLGQSAFFGLGGYAYGVLAINLGGVAGATGLSLLAGLLAAVVVAAALGWLVFYGRLRGVYVAIVMLVVTLVIETFLNQTAGPQWVVGRAHLGGNNGLGRFSGDIEDLPSLILGWGESAVELAGSSKAFFYAVLAALVVTYLGLRMLVNSRFGVILTAIREDPDRTESLGYDVRLVQTVAFCIGAFLAALSGILYVSWGNFITPSVFGVTSNIQPVIWVAICGRKSLAACIAGSVLLQWGSQALALQGEYALVVQGFLLVVAVLLLPEGLISLLSEPAAYIRKRRNRRLAAQAEA